MRHLFRSKWGTWIACLPVVCSVPLLQATPAAAQEVMSAGSDFGTLTFRSLPDFRRTGGFTAEPALIALIGYNPSRQWTDGQPLSTVAQLGDFQGSFDLQRFTVNDIGALTGLDINTISLSDLALLEWQTLEDLVAAIPELSNMRVAALPLARTILETTGISVAPGLTLEQALSNPAVRTLSLGSIDLPNYRLTDLPGLRDTPLENFRNWQRAPVAGVPGLIDVPFSQLPTPLPVPTMAHVDIVFSNAEGGLDRTISGSYQEGFAVPCGLGCAHIELGMPFEGIQWVSGLSQQVQGGHGVLGSLNDGLEPSGRHPFGNAFKVVVLETDEATGTAETGLYFRFCIKRTFVDLGCSPYFIGPVPWLPLQEEGFTVL